MATITSDVGSYAVKLSLGASTNYTFNFVDGTLTITQAIVNAKADNKTKVYGDANPTSTITYTGFKNGQDATILDVAPYSRPVATINADPTSSVGSYSITVAGGNHINYSFTYTSGTINVTKATLLATADNKTKVFGDGLPIFTATYTGFVNGDLPGVINSPPAMNTNPATNSISPVGNYTIEIKSGLDDNYLFTYAYGTMTVTKAMLTARPSNQTRTYGGNIASYTVVYTGFAPGQTETVIDTKATAKAIVDGTTDVSSITDVGSYSIVASGAVDDNYDFTYLPGTLTITKAPLKLTADAKSRVYGDANPAYTITYLGFQNGETELVLDDPKPVAATAPTVTPTSPVGLYDITIAPTTDNNYLYTYVGGKLTITKAGLTVTADDKTRPYNTANPIFTYHLTGLLNGDPTTVVMGVQFDSPAAIASPVGTYSITPKNGVSNNYTLSYAAGTITIIKGTPIVTWNNPSAISYGTPLSATQLNATANVPGAFLYNPVSGTVLTASGGQVLTANFIPSDLTNFNPVIGLTVTLPVTKANPTITWPNPAAITYGTPLSATQLNATSSVPGTFTYTPVLGTLLNAGANQQLKVDFQPSDIVNYNAVSVTRQITVNKQTPVVTWPALANITYGTPLGPTQQNATFNVPGTAAYIPGPGTILPTGANQVIS